MPLLGQPGPHHQAQDEAAAENGMGQEDPARGVEVVQHSPVEPGQGLFAAAVV